MKTNSLPFLNFDRNKNFTEYKSDLSREFFFFFINKLINSSLSANWENVFIYFYRCPFKVLNSSSNVPVQLGSLFLKIIFTPLHRLLYKLKRTPLLLCTSVEKEAVLQVISIDFRVIHAANKRGGYSWYYEVCVLFKILVWRKCQGNAWKKIQSEIRYYFFWLF